MRELTYQTYLALGKWLEKHVDTPVVLPSERTLSRQFKVGRATIRTALAELEREGRLQIDHRRGLRMLQKTVDVFRHRKLFIVPASPTLVRKSEEQIALLAGVSAQANTLGAQTVLCFDDAETILRDLGRHYDPREHAGIIFIELLKDWDIPTKPEGVIPQVIANLEARDATVPASRVNFRNAGRRAGLEFLARQHSRIGVYGNMPGILAHEMFAGLKGALAEEDLAIDERDVISEVIVGGTDAGRQAAQERIHAILARPDRPQAMLVMRNSRARKIIAAAAELKIAIPQELHLIVYDHIRPLESPFGSIDMLRQPAAELGSEAVRLLAEYLETGKPPADRRLDCRWDPAPENM